MKKLFQDLTKEDFNVLLNKLNACDEAKDWAKDKTAIEVIEQCYRGDWLLWLFKKLQPDNLQMLTLAKGHCANTVRHLMKDERSINAVNAAIKFGNGEITKEELKTAAYAAYAAYAANATDSATDAANAAYVDAKNGNMLLTANICRKYLLFTDIEIELSI